MRSRHRLVVIACTVLVLAVGFALVKQFERPAAHRTKGPAAPPPVKTVAAQPTVTAVEQRRYLRMMGAEDGQSFAPVQELSPPDPRSHFHNPAKPVCPAFPKNFAEPVRVRCGVADVSSRPLGARLDSVGTIADNGDLVYADAFAGCDVSYRCDAYKTEEFITVKDANAQTVWSWELDTHGLTPRLTPAHTIELCDAAGVPRLRINAPEGKDAAGKALRVGERLTLALDGNCATLMAKLDCCAFPVVIDPSWSSTSTLATARNSHRSILLNDGSVLVTGGEDSGGTTLSSCELFDPTSNTWSATGSMTTARETHTITLLGSGSVIVTGGFTVGGATSATCEIYDPSAKSWSMTGALNTSRSNHTATLLGNGRILVAGGSSGLTVFSSCELFSAGTWTFTNNLNTGRSGHTATLLNNGQVLVSSGTPDTSTEITSCELFNPSNNTWTFTGALTQARLLHTATLLNDGTVLVVGGQFDNGGPSVILSSCELYSPSLGTWSAVGGLSFVRVSHTANLLACGKVIVAGGSNTTGYTNTSELYDVSLKTWTTLDPMIDSRQRHSATLLPDNRLLIAGGSQFSGGSWNHCEVYDTRPAALPQSLAIHTSLPLSISLQAKTINQPLSYSIVTGPAHGTVSGSAPVLTYNSLAYAGSDSLTFKVNDGFLDSNIAIITINVTNQPPTVSATASPTNPIEGQASSFASTASDPDGDPLTYLWNFGDGSTSTDPNPTHVYSTAGTYQATCTVTDIANSSTTSNAVTITVYHDSDRPTARFVSSDLNGYVNSPVGFDATFSTDPLNNIVSYDWDFGDGSPHGAGQLISRAYTAEGTYTVRLTIVDGRGLSDTTTLTMVVLPSSQAGLLNPNIKYSVNWNRAATNADALSLSATVNVGTTAVTQTSPLSLNVVGQTFTGSSAAKLALNSRATSGPQVRWQVKPVKNAPKGTYAVKCSIKHASLGLAFALAGVSGTKSSSAKIPIRLGIDSSAFESSINSQFRFGSGGTRASGGGTGPK